MPIDLDKYKPGQIITSMSRRVFLELWDDIQSGAALERWAPGKEAQTKRERTEEMRIRAITMLCVDHRSVLKNLVHSDEWSIIEVYMGTDKILHIRAILSATERLERAKAIHRQYYGR